jgi:hypothetical protein
MKFPSSLPTPAHIAGAVLLAAAAVLPVRADYQSTVLSQGPVGYWRLNETVPPPVLPLFATNLGSVGPAGNGSLFSVSRGRPGALAGDTDTAFGFPGIDPVRVRVPWQPQWNVTTAYSVEFWAKPGQNSALACPAASVEFIPTPTQRNGWLIYQGDHTLATGNGFVFRQYNVTGLASQTAAAADIAIDTTKWYHVVATFDGTSLRLYVNGTLAAGPIAIAGGAARANTNSAVSLAFGGRSDGSQGYFSYNGLLDEAAMYNTALSAAQVLAHYQTGTNVAPVTPYNQVVLGDNPVGYWRFDAPGDPGAANLGSAGASANGSYISDARPGVAGPSSPPFSGFEAANHAVAFDNGGGGSFTGYVTIPPLSLNTNTVTITGWLNITNAQGNSAGLVVCRGGSTLAALTMDPLGYGGGHGLGYNWGGQGTSWSPFNDSGLPALPDSDWAFVALVIRPADATLFICNDTNYANFALATFTPPGGHLAQAFDSPTLLGLDTSTAGINGAMDEVAIFNRALGFGEVYTEYGAAVGNVPPKVFNDPQAPPIIYGGDTLVLTVDAGGTPNLTYQWRQNSGNLSGATSSAYTKPNVSAADNGLYDCVVNNAYGSVTSGVTVVTVTAQTAPSIVQGPIGRTLYPGGTLNLNVEAIGGGLTYQWQRSNTNLPGATSSAYVVPNVTSAVSGSYSVIVANVLGNVTAGPVTVTVPTLTTGSYAAVVAADAPTAWWRLDEAAGTATNGSIMFDAMGVHDGYYTNLGGGQVTLGTPGAIVGGIAGTAATFNGTNSFGYVPYSAALNGRAFSLECWVRQATVVNFVNPVSSHGQTRGYALDTQSGDWYGFEGLGGTDYIFGATPPPPPPNPNYNPAIIPGQWMHIVITCQPTGTFPWQIYINNQTDGYIWGGDFDRNPAYPFIIGGLGTGDASVASRWFQGDVDEVAVYPRVLTAAQIQAHYYAQTFNVAPYFTRLPASQDIISNSLATFTLSGSALGTQPITYQWFKNGTALSGATASSLTLSCAYSNAASYVLRAINTVTTSNSPPAIITMIPANPPFANVTNSLVLHMKFDNDYNDSSGHGNNGTPVGSNLQFVPGRLGSGGLFFYTTNASLDYNYVTLGHPTDLNFGASQNFSVAYWVKTFPGQTNGDLPFLCSAVNSTFGPGLTFAPSYKQGGWAWSLNALGIYGAGASINDGNWHHVLSTFNRSGNGITYLDGVQVDSRDITGAGNTDTGNTVNIGQDPTGTYTEDGSATIDDLAVWRRALSATEAYSIYYVATNSNSSFDVPGTVSLKIAKSGSNVQITWMPGATLGTLLQAPSLTGPWTPVSGIFTPSYTFTPTGTQMYFRLQTIE